MNLEKYVVSLPIISMKRTDVSDFHFDL